MTKFIRWAMALVVLVLIVVSWRITIAPWDPEIGGLYSFKRAVFNVLVTIAGLSATYVLLGRKPVKDKIQSVALGLVSAAVCLFLLEIPAIFFKLDYRAVFGNTGDKTALNLSEGVNKPDPVLLHIHWPNSSFSGAVTGNLAQLGIPNPNLYDVQVQYDGSGFRNDRDFEQADIVVIGDSFVEAAIVPRELSLVGVVESRLETPTANLGQIAYGFRQELEVLKRFAIPLSPKLVLWVLFGGNDLRDVGNYERGLRNFNRPAAPVSLEDRLFVRNVLVASGNILVRSVRSAVGAPTENALNHSGLFKRSDGATERVYFGQSAGPWKPHQWEVAVDTLRAANSLSQDAGARFVVVYIPRKFRVYRDHLELFEGHDIAKWSVNNLPDALAEWSAKNGIHFVDTTPHLAKLVSQGLHPYFIDDVHWNGLGHETAAKAIIAYLSAEGIIPF